MSLFGSLSTAVSGLTAQEQAIGNISDNIANAQTIGFKRIDTAFESLVTQSTPQTNSPGGVIARPVYQNSLKGIPIQSDTPTSLSVNGNGLFQVKAPPSAGQSGAAPIFSNEDLYTRRGDFTVDKQGFLVNGAGYYLEAYNVNPQTKVADTSKTAPVQISQLLDNPVATSNVTLAANLPSGFATQGTAGYVAPQPINVSVFDALGSSHAATIQFNKVGANTWTADISVAGTNRPTDVPTQLTFTFSPGGGPNDPGSVTSVTNTTSLPTPNPAGLTLPLGTVNIPASQTKGTADSVGITFDFGTPPATTGAPALPQTVNFNFGAFGVGQGLTQVADTSLVVNTRSSDGIPRGSFKDLSIDQQGFINLNYDNGQTQTFFQIPVVQFNAPTQLQRLDGGSFRQTPDSGTPRVGIAGQLGAGTISPQTLEQSNVDIATEFTKLISAQRVYSSNARVITTTDSLLQEVISLVKG